MTALNKKLSMLTLFAFVLCVVSFLPFVRGRSAPRAFESVLLNPSHRGDVTEISIAGGGMDADGTDAMDGGIVLRKSFGANGIAFWTVSNGLTIVRADEKLVQNLLDNVIKIRKMYEISDNVEKTQPLLENRPAIMFRNDNNLYTKIDFFGTNSLTNRIMFGVEGKKSLYETEDTLSQFLQPNVRYWAKPELVQTIGEPIAFVWEEKGKPSVTIETHFADFAQFSHDIMSLRHGAVIAPAVNNFKAICTASLFVMDKNGNAETIYFLRSDDGSYYCYYDIEQYDVVERPHLHFAFEISGWTYERLQALFASR